MTTAGVVPIEALYRPGRQDGPVVAVGETMLRLCPRKGEALEAARSLDVHVAGAESNVAAALARMGVGAAWISKLPDNPLGHLVASRIRGFGVDTGHIVWSRDGRLGLFFAEPEVTPRPTRVIYDRADSAFAHLLPEEIDWDFIGTARLVHLTGITPALGENGHRLSTELLSFCHAEQIPVSFDVNYRQGLWPPDAAGQCLSRLASRVSLLICSREDARRVFGIEAPQDEAVLEELRRRFNIPVVVVTLAGAGALASDGTRLWRAPAYPATAVDRIGRGDCFTAGLIVGCLAGDAAEGLKIGNAMAALNQTYEGDFFRCTGQDVRRVIEGAQIKLDR